MKNKILLFAALLIAGTLFVVSCEKDVAIDSTPQTVSIPYVAYSNLNSPYIYGEGSSTLYSDLPDVLGVLVDSVYGFEGGYGGKTGMDSVKILKTDIEAFGDTASVGSSTFAVTKYNKGGYRLAFGGAVVIAAPNNNPGPTNLAGTYKRTSNGFLQDITSVGPGIYLLYNPGGAGSVAPNPYLLYDYKDVNGNDSLAFANQTDLCGGGLMLVSPTAPDGLTSAEYAASYPPIIASMSPLTLQWKVFEFPSTSPSAQHPGAALCNWGLSVRTFEKQ